MTPNADLDLLESEAIHIIREVVAECARPVLLYSAGKDSSVLLHLTCKAFAPNPPPMPLLHIDTGWKFSQMYAQRDADAARSGMPLIVHRNEAATAAGVTPFNHPADVYTSLMKTVALREALDRHGFDAAFGGARRDEEKSRAKERMVSVRSAGHRWDPRRQRAELWSLHNARVGPLETLRVFPLSNWTELDVWRYIAREHLTVVPLYFAAERPVLQRGAQWLMRVDERMPLHADEHPVQRKVRFRTLGCYPLTAAIESEASTLEEIIDELQASRQGERVGRLIDHIAGDSMERKKREGYF
jgi:sulfate adenylyltransferase subunit 2